MSLHEEIDNTLLKRVLDDNLSENDVLVLKEKLKDPHFYDKFVDAIIQQQGRKSLKQTLQSIAEEESIPKQKKAFPWLYAAAFIAVIVGLTYFLSPDSHNLFEKYFEVYPDVFVVKGESQESNPTFERAMGAYNTGAFQKAIDIFAQMEKEKALNDPEQFYYGIALLTLGNSSESEKYLKAVSENQNPFKKQAEWYLVLSYLKQNKKEKAREILSGMISKTNGTLQVQAKALLAELENP